MSYPTKKQLNELRKISVHRLWLDNYDRLVQFYNLFHRFPKRHEKYCGYQMGAWCLRQRRKYKDGILALWRFEMLDAVDFKVELPDAFEENVKQIGQLWKEHPKSWPFLPRKNCLSDYNRLQAWMQDNRKRYLNGELNKRQIKLLNSVRFPLDTDILKWEQDIINFRNFVERHNRYPKRTKFDDEENKLAEWRFRKIQLFKEGLLPKDKLKALKSIRPDLLKNTLIKKPSWELNYERLKDIWENETELKGKIPVPKNHKDYILWYKWFNCNKWRFNNGSLSKAKISLLKRIGFDFLQRCYARKD